MNGRQVRADVTGVGENSAPPARKNPFLRAPVIVAGAALALAGIANFVLPFASFEGRRFVGEGGPAIMSNDSNLPKFYFPTGVCRVPEEDFKPTMALHNRVKE